MVFVHRNSFQVPGIERPMRHRTRDLQDERPSTQAQPALQLELPLLATDYRLRSLELWKRPRWRGERTTAGCKTASYI